MAPKYRLTYFNFRGIIEAARYIFAYAKVPYDDIRIEKEQWPELKPKQPFGKIPVLEVDGVVISESQAIMRYLAKEFGLAGKNNLESARCDMIVSALGDTFSSGLAYHLEQDPAKKEELKRKFIAENLVPFLGYAQKQLQANGGKHFVGSSLSWADLAVARILWELKNLESTLLDKFDQLRELTEMVHNIPQIKTWLAQRPKTET